jgi:serine/threonine-protein kinase
MGDARIAIEEALRTPSDPSRGSSTAKLRPKWIAFLPWGFAAASLLALAWIGLSGSPTPPRPPVMRFTMSIAPDQLMVAAPMPVLAVSRDGRRVAYVGRSGDERLLFLRQIHQEEATPLKGTEDATVPFFSPDGEWIGFESNGKLKKISVLGGPPITLCDARRLRGATWGTDGTIVFAPNRSGGLVRVSEAGGEPEPLTRVESTGDSLNDPSDRWPQWLPGNRVVLFTSTEDNGQFSDARIEVLDLVEKTQKTLISGGTFARFVPPEFLIYARESTVFATRFDPETLTLTGPAVPVLEGVSAVNEYGTAHLAFSDTGTLLYLSGTGMAGQERLVWTDREGVETQASAHQRDFGWVSLSPDGTQLALEIIPNNSTGGDIWVLELARDTLTRLTVDDAWDIDPLWSPDGEWIAFTSTRQSNERNLFRKRADGTDDVERLTTSERRQSIQDWSPDGSVILFLEYTEENGPDILAYHAGADPETQAVVATRFAEWSAQLSPDGRWLAYASNKSGAPEIYVCASDGAGKHTKISTSSGVVVRWAPHRDELIYRDRDGKLMSALFTIDQTGFRPALPVELIDFPAPPHSFPFAVSLDGQRFLTYKDASPDAGERREPHVVINWAEELETRVPASR